MLSYTQALTLYQYLTNNSETGNTSLFNIIYNEKIRTLLSLRDWPFLERSTTSGETIADTQSYYLPAGLKKLKNVYITSGSTNYIPKECPTRKIWDKLNENLQYSDSLEYFTIINNKIYFFPIPATSDLVITYRYIVKQKDLTIADYTTGTVVSVPYTTTFTAVFAGTETTGTLSSAWELTTGTYRIILSSGEIRTATLTNGSTAVIFSSALTEAATATATFESSDGGSIVVGTGTTWTTKMIGRFIRITDSDTANAGDGEWYEIANVLNATTIVLTEKYNGVSIAAASVAYKIGQISYIPEDYHIIPVYESVADYWAKEQNTNLSTFYQNKAEALKIEMFNEYYGMTDEVAMEDDIQMINPNLTINAIT